ncbi:MAG: peptidoglycan DD-metalloendopeptidase family protein [Thermodesulfobacteriota bacterium]|nr:peptidoglycan DD-metalloendopeptidase family protein [Thermodesulfobacteriota bacterium]
MSHNANRRRHTPIISTRRRKQNRSLFLILAGIALLLFAFIYSDKPEQLTTTDTTSSEVPAPLAFREPAADTVIQIQRETICQSVQRGDTITAILGRYFSPAEILVIARKSQEVFPLSSLCAGHPYRIELENENFVSFYYDIDKEDQLIIEQHDDQFHIKRQAIPYTVKVETIGGMIHSSLFGTIAELGESSVLAIRIMNIFAWDIDFIRDIRHGDYFTALVEKRYRDDNLAGYGNLLAAEFNNRNQSYYAFRFNDGDDNKDSGFGYFDEQGKSLRKAFLKAPLSYTRISSGYTNRRFHPIQNRWKPHRAIDYAAPIGTPVKAVADGTVTQKSYDKYNGNKIRIRHPNSYETTYIHLSKFARGMKKGRRVHQGEVIAYVGTTGMSTGPHLDFRIFKNGQAINPLKMKSTPSKPIAKACREAFASVVNQRKQQLHAAQQQLTIATTQEKTTEH